MSRCLVHPSFKIQALLRAVLRDEMIAWHKKNSDSSQQAGATSEAGAAAPAQTEQKDGEVIIATVGKAVTAITARLTSLSQFDGTESKVRTSSLLFH